MLIRTWPATVRVFDDLGILVVLMALVWFDSLCIFVDSILGFTTLDLGSIRLFAAATMAVASIAMLARSVKTLSEMGGEVIGKDLDADDSRLP